MKEIKEQKPDVILNMGDMGELLMGSKQEKYLDTLLNSCPHTLYILGNHDLYAYPKRIPPQAMSDYLKLLNIGIPLQKSWEDNETVFVQDDCVFCGMIGWPDFLSPRLHLPPEYYEKHCPTIDASHIDLSLGWKQYGKTQYDSFEQKLLKVAGLPQNNIIIITHYSIFESQYCISNEDISAYFFCYTIGEIVKKIAANHPTKNFYCFSAHGHEFNRNKWGSEGINIVTLGLATTYYQQDYLIFDTDKKG